MQNNPRARYSGTIEITATKGGLDVRLDSENSGFNMRRYRKKKNSKKIACICPIVKKKTNPRARNSGTIGVTRMKRELDV
jgi:hypothetical protein